MKKPITDFDTIGFRVETEDNKILYMKIWFSNNPPADSNNPGCIGIQIYDEHMRELDGGELDYKDENVLLYDTYKDCLEFMDIKVKSIKSTKFLKMVD